MSAGTPPRRLSNDPNHADFHPSFLRVGVLIDGAERKDLQWYDATGGFYRVSGSDELVPGVVEPFWRWEETRQERRQRERWETKHGGRP